ncbi:MAG TPA: hypothetical protein VKY89_06970 [Thermoanaerobaculia bacterium]|nr:hypothetical protein [Thermoanaerobaculia bacterium]
MVALLARAAADACRQIGYRPIPVTSPSRARLVPGHVRAIDAGAGLMAGRAKAAAVLVAITLAAAANATAQEPAAAATTPAKRGSGATTTPEPGTGAGDSASTAICDASTALTAIGIDTDSGLVLFAVAGPGGGAGAWTVALDLGSEHAGHGATKTSPAGAANDAANAGDASSSGTGAAAPEAHAYPEQQGGRFGGSVGPGPVVALEPCGPVCLQPVRFGDGAWRPLGEPVTVPAASTAAATYDAGGTPWLVAHTAATQDGQVQAFAFRYAGREWKSRGSLVVTAVGQPQAVPAPQRRDAVISGTGLFSAGGPPATWVLGLPGLPPARRGQLLALTADDDAYISGDGIAYLSSDGGKTWRRSTWTPWGGGDTTGMWRQGTDYVIDLPVGDHYGALQLAWYDRRSAAAERVVLTRLGAGGSWSELAAAPVDVTTRNGEHLPVTQALIPRAGEWILLSGCAATAGGSGLVLRTFEKGRLSDPRFVPIVLEPKAPAARPPAPGR